VPVAVHSRSFAPPHTRALAAVVIAFSLLVSPLTSFANDQEVASAKFDDDQDEAPVLINRSRPLKLNVEVSALFMPTLIEKYLNHIGGAVGVSLHFTDWIAVEVFGGYLYMRETSIIGGNEGVRFSIATDRNEKRNPNLPDLVGMSWFVQGGLTFAPIYGKLNFFSEFDLTAQLYLAGGVGVVGAVRRDITGVDEVTTNLVNAGVKFSGNVGFGFRLFFNKFFAIRAEFRDFIFSDSFVFTSGGAAEVDIIHNFMGLFGLSFIVN
jgi:outer membrane beta-barrel protein